MASAPPSEAPTRIQITPNHQPYSSNAIPLSRLPKNAGLDATYVKVRQSVAHPVNSAALLGGV
jgi:hypothetical protein